MPTEEREEERRYDEAGHELRRDLDRRLLEDPIRVLGPKAATVVEASDTVAAAVRRMAGSRKGCVVVVENGSLIGIFTERDLLTRVVVPERDMTTVTVGEVMTSQPEFLMLDDTLGYALHKMAVRSIRHLPVIDENRHPVGVLTQQQGVRYLAGFFPAAVINQPPRSIEQRPPRNQHGG